jgi:hypothetical protein
MPSTTFGGGCQPGGGATATMLSHIGQVKIAPIAASLRTAKRRSQVGQSIVNRGSSTAPYPDLGRRQSEPAGTASDGLLSILGRPAHTPPALCGFLRTERLVNHSDTLLGGGWRVAAPERASEEEGE